MAKLKIKAGDNVIVIAGRDKNKTGTVLRVFPETNKAIVEGVNIVQKHEKPSASNPQGGIVQKETLIQISNIAVVDPKTKKATKIGYRVEDGNKIRFAKKSNQAL
ncbi:MAG TPA: 50S ribosomal protein L24 [Flavobacteriaceae bacterium]|nr:50S ribosomal protein L24 [Flavobacteriaceae bacterium]